MRSHAQNTVKQKHSAAAEYNQNSRKELHIQCKTEEAFIFGDLPAILAACNGVVPFWLTAFTLAPFSINASIARSSSARAAKCSGVFP